MTIKYVYAGEVQFDVQGVQLHFNQAIGIEDHKNIDFDIAIYNLHT